MGVGDQLHVLAILFPGSDWLGSWVTPEPVWMWWQREKKIPALARNETIVIQTKA
jgi:hypothetical protein